MTHAIQLPAAAPPPASAQDVSTRLYRAAIGPRAQQRYLQVFAAFDARGKAGPGWHWAACISALNWLVARNLGALAWGWACLATLTSLVVLGLARMVWGASDAQLGWLALALVLLASAAWGLLADAVYYRVCNRRILRAVADSRHLDDACRKLQAQAGRAPGMRLTALNAGLAALVAGAVLLGQSAPPVSSASPHAGTVAHAWPAASEPAAPASPPVPAPAPTAAADTSANTAASAAEPASVPCGDCSPAPAAAAASAPAPQPTLQHAATAPPTLKPATAPEPERRGFAVQIGIFAQPANARKVLDTLKAARIEAYAEAAPQAPEHQRVRAGPFGTQQQAQRAAERIRALDLPGVVVRLRD